MTCEICGKEVGVDRYDIPFYDQEKYYHEDCFSTVSWIYEHIDLAKEIVDDARTADEARKAQEEES